ncbi:HIT family protein [Sphingomonas oleivorans]|uniref:HIT family protein n=1 Tax=Sphingomonas oleivorans TaxID=1735121 RepID=A0A2T5FY64_9SPHN|nr:HIT family protein [Sphingomonas oleivorans]PTQ11456.1 HIT family protein [Sphingomonas oleivorans]
MNETIHRFGYPETLIAEYPHWVVLLRPEQPTVGSLVLAAKGDAEAFGDLSPEAFSELATVIAAIEQALTQAVNYQKINYLMLMMVDRHVHFHVIPRYDGERMVAGISLPDAGWPKAPALGQSVALDSAQVAALCGAIRNAWPSAR